MNSKTPDLQSNTGRWRIVVRWLRKRRKNYSYTNGTMEVFYDTELQKVICSNSEQWQVDSSFELWWSLCLCIYFYELVHLVVLASLTDRILILFLDTLFSTTIHWETTFCMYFESENFEWNTKIFLNSEHQSNESNFKWNTKLVYLFSTKSRKKNTENLSTYIQFWTFASKRLKNLFTSDVDDIDSIHNWMSMLVVAIYL